MYSKYKTLTRLTEEEKKTFLEKKYPKRKEESRGTEKKVTIEPKKVEKAPVTKKSEIKKSKIKKWNLVLFVLFIVIAVPLIIKTQKNAAKYEDGIRFWLECGVSHDGMLIGLCENYGVSEEKAERIMDKYAGDVNWYEQAAIRAQNCMNREDDVLNVYWSGSPMIEQGEVALYNHELFYDEMNYNGMVDVLEMELFTELEAAYGAECIFGNETERAKSFADEYVAEYGYEGLSEAMQEEGFSLRAISEVESNIRDRLLEAFYQ